MKTLIALSIVPFAAIQSYAALVLTVDEVNETVLLSGSATGTTTGSGMPTTYDVIWSVGQQTGSVGNLDMDAAINESVFSTALSFYTDGPTGFRYNVSAVSPITDITATGIPISYASLTNDQKNILEAQIGTTVPPTSGSGFGNLSVVAVPEPSSFAALLGGIACALTIVRRRR